jgi:23S rRNA pseudouridine1911/1915/1917 synthase
LKTRVQTDGVLFDLLVSALPDASKSTLRKMLRHEQVRVDGRVILRADAPVKTGQWIEVSSARKSTARPPGAILFSDRHLLGVEKPAGILAVARVGEGEDTFYRQLNEFVQATSRGRDRIFIVHRLDREVSGVMVFALSERVQERLQRTWATTEKRYWALVEGAPPEEKGTISTYLRENRAHKVYSVREGPDAQLAITHYRVHRTNTKRSLLEVRIETGRKNQIRAHLSELGCPIVGDRKYGALTDPIHRVGLHAFHLGLTHPVTGERVRLRLPIPGAFRVG